MQTAKYRIYVDGAAIAQQALDAIDTIVVEQEMDQHLDRLHRGPRPPPATAAAGQVRTARSSSRSFRSGSRWPVDDSKSWVPLIDGPVTGYEASLSPEPSQSTLQVRVSDDSIRLWRQDDTQRWTGDTDADKARNIFNHSRVVHRRSRRSHGRGHWRSPDGDDAAIHPARDAASAGEQSPAVSRLGCRGRRAGQSIGMFKQEDTATSGLPPLILLGLGRNLDSFSVNNDQQRAADVTSWQLNLSDLSVKSGKASYGDQVAGNDAPAVPPANTAQIMVPPGRGYGVDADELAKRHAAELGVLFDARGTVRSRCYGGVLQPYKMVEVESINGLLSGNYVIKSVTHTLARSEYTQEFSLIRRGQSGGADAANPNVPDEPVS